jgi:hypothetical protein
VNPHACSKASLHYQGCMEITEEDRQRTLIAHGRPLNSENDSQRHTWDTGRSPEANNPVAPVAVRQYLNLALDLALQSSNTRRRTKP